MTQVNYRSKAAIPLVVLSTDHTYTVHVFRKVSSRFVLLKLIGIPYSSLTMYILSGISHGDISQEENVVDFLPATMEKLSQPPEKQVKNGLVHSTVIVTGV